MRRATLIELPYDSGRLNERMGRGPQVLLPALTRELTDSGVEVETAPVRLREQFVTEGNALVELQRGGVAAARSAINRGSRPIFFSGNCGPAALSAVAALGPDTTGAVWFDAHGDFNTPETSPSAFLDGMSLAVLVGDCLARLVERFDGFKPVPANHIIQVGVRDCDREEELRLGRSGIQRVGPSELAQLAPAVADLARRVSRVYVHVDVDVLDTSIGRANGYACAGGLSVEQLRAAIACVAESLPIVAASITAYDPEADESGGIGRAIPQIVKLLAR